MDLLTIYLLRYAAYIQGITDLIVYIKDARRSQKIFLKKLSDYKEKIRNI